MRRIVTAFNLNRAISDEPYIGATEVITDSTSAISLVTKPNVLERNEHIEIKAHHIKERKNKEKSYLNKPRHTICQQTS